MNTINFIQTGGVPFTNDVAQEFENAYKIFNAYGALAGDKTIISGCVENGSSISDGFIYVNSELFYFEGGSKSDNILISFFLIFNQTTTDDEGKLYAGLISFFLIFNQTTTCLT